ncbi:ATP-binding protein [Sulfitobacter indolifex]|uniref:ATP-binding protein n=1 Tax=Sulfitobacter indolifex TaxID=225422 RepID=UPI00389B321B
MPSGHRLQFTAVGDVRITVEETPPNAFVIIRVSDTGVGIGPNLQGKLFEEFEGHDPRTAREGGGTGLGMNIIKREIELLGGTISLTSHLGKGTQFEVYLPTAGSLANNTQLESEPQSDPSQLTCLECGAKLSLLRRHLRQEHGMSPEVYRAKWGLPEDFELSSGAYRAMRAAAKRDK